ncbi:MAG: SLC13 family permease [Lautropia sp.]|nr:SLC13 family permease [Lautropia sp.]
MSRRPTPEAPTARSVDMMETDAVFYRTSTSINLPRASRAASAAGSAARTTQAPRRRWLADLSARHLVAIGAAIVVVGLVALWISVALANPPGSTTGLTVKAAMTLSLFAIAVWFWIFTTIDDTYVALGAAVLLVVTGVLPEETLFDTLGEDTVWLLLGSFVIAAGITTTGLATRAAAFIVTGARNPRQLMHLSNAALVATAFTVPSTSGRAALAMPVFMALASVLGGRSRLIVALALLFPSVILLTAVASYLGAGAHLITSQILVASGEPGFSFATWMLYGLPLAVVSSLICVELILMLFTTPEERREPLSVTIADLQAHTPIPISGKLTFAQTKAAWLVVAVVFLWCAEPLHGVHPAVIALAGGLAMTSDSLGVVKLGKALKSVPWSLLIFMAATLAMGAALASSGAARWAAESMLAPIHHSGQAAAIIFVVLIVLISTAAHLIIQSRSARSAVLIPLVVSMAPEVGVNAVAAAFASTAAAGFCHTMSSSAKPMALFSKIEDTETYTARDLLRLSAWLAPISALLVLLFAFVIWPMQGMPLMLPR